MDCTSRRMQDEPLKLRFKGDRRYVHGSDVFSSVDRVVREHDSDAFVAQLAFRRVGRHDCELRWSKPSPTDSLVAQGRVKTGGRMRPFWVVETAAAVGDRYEFEEDRLTSTAIIDGESIELPERTSYSTIEEVIALTKRLNYTLSPDVDGKWVFGELKLTSSFPDDYLVIRISRTKEVGGRFSVNRINIDGNPIGDIRFIVGKP